jgi:hypothetical protein
MTSTNNIRKLTPHPIAMTMKIPPTASIDNPWFPSVVWHDTVPFFHHLSFNSVIMVSDCICNILQKKNYHGLIGVSNCLTPTQGLIGKYTY